MNGRAMRVTLGVEYCGKRTERGPFMDNTEVYECSEKGHAGVTEEDTENKRMETGDQL